MKIEETVSDKMRRDKINKINETRIKKRRYEERRDKMILEETT